ncbi:hypothetical protein [Halorhodospira halophila]|uniref:DUF4399 domain-containing protein n=2 Tax=Halorhodospira halophila TaxID=1053 RepID=A1WUW5_HALHL|nr:hypothetical protein [Halorhodospira halophila]ABM61477.1 hypothetical protein Hhal_0695 [Halorhodospira halophila SL1]
MRRANRHWTLAFAGSTLGVSLLTAGSAGAETPGSDQADFTQEVEVVEAASAEIKEPNPHLELNGGAPVTAGESASGAFKYLVVGLGTMEISFDGTLQEAPDGGSEHANLEVPDDRHEFVKLLHKDTGEVTAETEEEAPSGGYQWEVTITAAYDW